MSLGATLKVSDFNKQELIHAAAITNFDDVAFGTTLMSGKIVNEKGVMNFLDMMDLLDHVEEIGGTVYGSPIVANANQADAWLKTLTAPIEIPVDPIHDITVDYTTMEEFTGTAVSGKPSIQKNYDDGKNALRVPRKAKVYIVEGFDIDPLGEYTVTFNAKVDKDETIICTFCDNKIMEDEKNEKKYAIKAGKWQKVVVESKPAEGATYGYLMIEGNLNSIVYIKDVTVVHNPDNHRPQTAQEKNDTIKYALNAWCDGLMKINEGRIKTFDLIEEPIDSKSILDNGMYDLKKGTDDQIFWQDALGNENYAPVVSEVAKSAFANHEGDPAELKFFICESGLADAKKMERLMYWIGMWDAKGAKIDGINAKLSLDELAKTGKLIRLSNLDIKYQNVEGLNVAASDITEAQRQKLADYYGYVIKSYMKKIPNEKQAGICKGNMADTSDPVGLWAIDSKSKDWVRTATYKAFCDALQAE